MPSHVQAADQYAADVLSERIPAGRWVRLACERYIADRARCDASPRPFGWLYAFDSAKAEKVSTFIEYLPHTKGRWAAAGERLRLEPWQSFILVNVFGFVRLSDQSRRFRDAMIVVPRKNGKSLLSAGVGLFMLLADGEHGAEVYSGATSEKQAWEVFRPARLMALGTPALLSHYQVEVSASNIHRLSNSSRFEPLIGKPGDGASPSCAIIDEFHEHADSAQFDTMLTGQGARVQPLMWVITTAGDNIEGPCYDRVLTSRHILEGVHSDDEKFYIEYSIDVHDDWTSELAIRKANPNVNVSVSLEFLQARQREAIANAREQGRFKVKHLCQWVQSRNAAFNMAKWRACYDPNLMIEDFAGRMAWIAMDLASESDLAAIEVLTPDGEGYARFGRCYAPEATVELPENARYRAWAEEGHLIVTYGAMIDFARIEADIVEIVANFSNAELAFDPYQATYLVTRLMDHHGIDCVKYPQNVMTMSPAMKRLDALILDGKIRHACDDRHPMTWQMSNVVSRVDAKDNWYPRKERRERKIDSPVALIMAIGRCMTADESPYADGRGLFFLE
jgi:phage terminase large subunit-like protein